MLIVCLIDLLIDWFIACQELHDSLPTDPFEADLLKMAEMVEQAEREAPDVPVHIPTTRQCPRDPALPPT